MQLDNQTPYSALLSRFCASTDVMGSTLVVRVTYDLAGSRLTPSAEQSWKVSPTPWECPYGPMEADDAFYKGGTDVFLFGHARAPGGRPVPSMDVTVRVGAFERALTVFGDRTWTRTPGRQDLAPSRPVPFVEMPLSLERAYGGMAEWDGLAVPFLDNPAGKGFYLEAEQAVNHALPNLEDPRSPIRRWNDQPSPVGLGACPLAHSGRFRAGTTFDDEGVLTRLDGRFFNAAFPEMVAPPVEPGTEVMVEGVHHEGPLHFRMPPVPVALRLAFDGTSIVRQPVIDQIGIEADRARVFVTYRHPFRYVLHRWQRREAALLPVEMEARAPALPPRQVGQSGPAKDR
jgi:hypothetical protein